MKVGPSNKDLSDKSPLFVDDSLVHYGYEFHGGVVCIREGRQGRTH